MAGVLCLSNVSNIQQCSATTVTEFQLLVQFSWIMIWHKFV